MNPISEKDIRNIRYSLYRIVNYLVEFENQIQKNKDPNCLASKGYFKKAQRFLNDIEDDYM